MPDHVLVTSLQELHDTEVSLANDLQDTLAVIDSHVAQTDADVLDGNNEVITMYLDFATRFNAIITQANDFYLSEISWLESIFSDTEAIGNELNHATYGLIDHQQSLLDNANAILTGLSGLLTAVDDARTALAAHITTHDDHVYGHVTTAIDDTLAVGVALAGAEAAILLAQSGDTATLQGEHATITADLTTLLARPAARLPALPTYTVLDEHDWDQQDDWNQAADFYLVTVTSWPSSQGEQPSGVVRLPHIGWTAVKGPAGAVDELQQIDYVNRVVTSPSVAPQGLLIYAKPGTTGHVQACLNA